MRMLIKSASLTLMLIIDILIVKFAGRFIGNLTSTAFWLALAAVFFLTVSVYLWIKGDY